MAGTNHNSRSDFQVCNTSLHIACGVLALAVVGVIVWLVILFWPRRIIDTGLRASLAIDCEPNGTRVWQPGTKLIGMLDEYDDELYTFMMFDYLRSRKRFATSELLVTYIDIANRPRYRVHVVLANNLVTAVPALFQLEAAGFARLPSWSFVPLATLDRMRRQTDLFVRAYTAPVQKRLEQLPAAERSSYVRRFLRFKSWTDPRVRRGVAPVQPLTRKQAGELAADIIAVADFYDLPLEYFLGIGAMENNYMNVKGDLDHAVWKRRADKGDIVIRRGRTGRVLVKNFSLGVWQITRETLRLCHSLFLADKRDYSKLPDRLRPSRTLDIDTVEPDVLRTYAGLLLRYLLDYFHGDVTRAVGAYNGGVQNPNVAYEAGVSSVAQYARRILGRAAAMKDATVASRTAAVRRSD